MGRRRAPGAGSLGRALIRHQTQRSRNQRYADSWVRQTVSSFSGFLSSYENMNVRKPRVKGPGNFPEEATQKKGFEG